MTNLAKRTVYRILILLLCWGNTVSFLAQYAQQGVLPNRIIVHQQPPYYERSTHFGDSERSKYINLDRLLLVKKEGYRFHRFYGDAYNLTCAWADTLQERIGDASQGLMLDILQIADVDTLIKRLTSRKDKSIDIRDNAEKLAQVFNSLTIKPPSRLQSSNDNYEDGMIAFYFNGEHCMLLWDNINYRTIYAKETRNGYIPYYSFNYNLNDAKQLVMCAYRGCYVLLLLTKPIVPLN